MLMMVTRRTCHTAAGTAKRLGFTPAARSVPKGCDSSVRPVPEIRVTLIEAHESEAPGAYYKTSKDAKAHSDAGIEFWVGGREDASVDFFAWGY